MQNEREKHQRLEWKVFSPFLIESIQVFIFWSKVIFSFDNWFWLKFETFYIWMSMRPFAIPDMYFSDQY